MSTYVVFTRIPTRDPAELAQYTAQAPAFVAGHTVERLANFGACAVLEGPGVEGVYSGDSAAVVCASVCWRDN